ncbi:MAG: hypothetical protein GF355_01410 [Candidatus Eisenbacteria bacterium]|nr:hypothetical protein [Candidatus Eisenbacteria bacterium]
MRKRDMVQTACVHDFRRAVVWLGLGLLALNLAVVWHLAVIREMHAAGVARQILPGLAGSFLLLAGLGWLARRAASWRLQITPDGIAFDDGRRTLCLAWSELERVRLAGNQLILQAGGQRLSLNPALVVGRDIDPARAWRNLLLLLNEKAPQAAWSPAELRERLNELPDPGSC